MKTSSLSKSQRRYRRVLESARQTRVSSARMQEAFEELKRRMAENPYFFGTLAPLNNRSVPVRLFEHKGVKLAVKSCGFSNALAQLQGAAVENYAKFMKFHEQAVKRGLISPSNYVLTALPLVGVFESDGFSEGEVKPHTFIAMKVLLPSIAEPWSRDWNFFPDVKKKRARAAILELERNSHIVEANYDVWAPQAADALVLGNLNSKRSVKGWVLAPPHDYI